MTYSNEAIASFDARYIPEPNCGCWLWTGALTKRGYGVFNRAKSAQAHRASWEIHCGLIPKGLCVLHRCDNPACVNPEHLFLGTHKDNMNDMHRKGRSADAVYPERWKEHGRRLGRGPKVRGEKHHSSKLTAEKVRAIRALSRAGMTNRGLARSYLVNPSTIAKIVNGKLWSEDTDARS